MRCAIVHSKASPNNVDCAEEESVTVCLRPTTDVNSNNTVEATVVVPRPATPLPGGEIDQLRRRLGKRRVAVAGEGLAGKKLRDAEDFWF